jgi:hypothetical protein
MARAAKHVEEKAEQASASSLSHGALLVTVTVNQQCRNTFL